MKKINFEAKIKLDKTRPNGTPRKIIDSSLALKYGWKAMIDLEKGFELTYADFLKKFG